jgi:hypothetical protein
LPVVIVLAEIPPLELIVVLPADSDGALMPLALIVVLPAVIVPFEPIVVLPTLTPLELMIVLPADMVPLELIVVLPAVIPLAERVVFPAVMPFAESVVLPMLTPLADIVVLPILRLEAATFFQTNLSAVEGGVGGIIVYSQTYTPSSQRYLSGRGGLAVNGFGNAKAMDSL